MDAWRKAIALQISRTGPGYFRTYHSAQFGATENLAGSSLRDTAVEKKAGGEQMEISKTILGAITQALECEEERLEPGSVRELWPWIVREGTTRIGFAISWSGNSLTEFLSGRWRRKRKLAKYPRRVCWFAAAPLWN